MFSLNAKPTLGRKGICRFVSYWGSLKRLDKTIFWTIIRYKIKCWKSWNNFSVHCAWAFPLRSLISSSNMCEAESKRHALLIFLLKLNLWELEKSINTDYDTFNENSSSNIRSVSGLESHVMSSPRSTHLQMYPAGC